MQLDGGEAKRIKVIRMLRFSGRMKISFDRQRGIVRWGDSIYADNQNL